MSFLDTPHKKKSAMLTSIIVLLLLIVFSWIGLSYFDPPISYGMEVNFGTTSEGKGKTPPKTQPKQVEQQEVNSKAEITKTTPKVNEV
ncbi:MAG: energy transducer TonB, partial [Flavobacteriaceae bacterium]|nr:energy transducer TonB [Flavobacteriaceae bacterium]